MPRPPPLARPPRNRAANLGPTTWRGDAALSRPRPPTHPRTKASCTWGVLLALALAASQAQGQVLLASWAPTFNASADATTGWFASPIFSGTWSYGAADDGTKAANSSLTGQNYGTGAPTWYVDDGNFLVAGTWQYASSNSYIQFVVRRTPWGKVGRCG